MSVTTLEAHSDVADSPGRDETPSPRGGHLFVVHPPTVDRVTAVAVLRDDTEYDFTANGDMNQVEVGSARGIQP